MDEPGNSAITAADCESNIARALAEGRLVRQGDGGLSLPPHKPGFDFLQVKIAGDYDCEALNAFLFRNVYDKAAVPHGCRACYKVKAVPRDLRGLVALRDILEGLPYHAKCGVDLNNPFSRDAYAAYLYLDGLEDARMAWHDLRRHVDADAALGPEVPIRIKRGCSNYEAACGPSDAWRFGGMEALEQEFRARFVGRTHPPRDYRLRRAQTMNSWIRTAWSIGDDSYLDFTRGVPLHPAQVSYAPGDCPPILEES